MGAFPGADSLAIYGRCSLRPGYKIWLPRTAGEGCNSEPEYANLTPLGD